MARLIDEFVEKVKNREYSFNIACKDGDSTKLYMYMTRNVGKAKYIYGEYSWGEDSISNIRLKPELVAIYSDGIIYIMNNYHFVLYKQDDSLPDNVMSFYQKRQEILEASKKICITFYNGLCIKDLTDERDIEYCQKDARKIRLALAPKGNKIPYPDIDIKEQEIAEIICGFTSMESLVEKRLKEKEELYVHWKSCYEYTNKLAKSDGFVEKYEDEIINGLRTVDAKTVNVEFELNGKTAVGKMSPERIMLIMCDRNDAFSNYDFDTSVMGKKLMHDLEADSWRGSKNALRCSNITRITYGRKELYVRKDMRVEQ